MGLEEISYPVDFSVKLSAYTNEDSNGDAMLKAHAYKAATAGFVSAFVSLTNSNTSIRCYVGLTNDPEGAGDQIGANEADANASLKSLFFAVAEGEYFEITSPSGAPTIRWKSFGTLSKPVDQD